MISGLKQRTLFNTIPNPTDVVYTPAHVAKDIIDWVHPEGLCLDPCIGDGAFYNAMPPERDWCEIEQGRDFFEYTNHVDWIIGNPPYSIFESFLSHSFSLSKNVVFLVPTNKIFQRKKIMTMINEFGGIKGMRIYGSGTSIGFPFGFSVGAFYFVRNYNGDASVVLAPTCNPEI